MERRGDVQGDGGGCRAPNRGRMRATAASRVPGAALDNTPVLPSDGRCVTGVQVGRRVLHSERLDVGSDQGREGEGVRITAFEGGGRKVGRGGAAGGKKGGGEG